MKIRSSAVLCGLLAASLITQPLATVAQAGKATGTRDPTLPA